MQNLSDKLIDSQGNTGTYSSGADSKLYYVDVDGNKANYLTQADVDGVVETSATTLSHLQNNRLLKFTEPVTDIRLVCTKDLKNAQVIFETGQLTLAGYSIDSGMYINREFDFDSYKVYYVSVSNGIILWNELIEINN